MAWGRLILSLLQGVDPLLLMGEALCYQVDRSGSGGCWRLWCSGGWVLLGTAAIASSSAASTERLARWLLTWLLLLLLTGLGRWVVDFRAVLGGVSRPGTCMAPGGLVAGVRVATDTSPISKKLGWWTKGCFLRHCAHFPYTFTRQNSRQTEDRSAY